MERYNIFDQFQKNLFNLLEGTALLMEETDFNSIVQTDKFMEHLKEVTRMVNLQIQLEETHIYEPIENWEPYVCEKFGQAHASIRAQSNKILRLISLFNKLYFGYERKQVLINLKNACSEFIDLNIEHMVSEKNTVNRVLCKYNSDYDLKEINAVMKSGGMSGNISPIISKTQRSVMKFHHRR